jgi:Tol biopolymer transport system component
MHLWIADTANDTSTPVTSTVGSENHPDVSRDGRQLAFASEAIDFNLVDIPLDGSPPRNLLATSRNELDPSFNRDGTQYAYVSDKGGVLRIWARRRNDETSDTVVVAPDQFPSGDATLALGALAMSPDGERVAYQRYSPAGYRIWISTVRTAGTPVLLGPDSLYQDAPTWSPDGSTVAFLARTKDQDAALMTVRVGTDRPPAILPTDSPSLGMRPQWSPDGKWIAVQTGEGVYIVSPDGKQKRKITDDFWLASTWAPDSKQVYVVREADKLRHYELTSLDIETGQERVINGDLGPIPHASQPIRGLTLSGPGTLTTSVASARSDIWVMDEFFTPRGLFDRLFRRR